jgi:hypothetical protein
VAILGIADLPSATCCPNGSRHRSRPAPADGGRSMLDAIADDQHERVLERTRRSFDWAWSA